MKRLSLLFSVLLVVWIVLATYWYVCKIRNNCGKDTQEALSEVADSLKSGPETPDSVLIATNYLREIGTRFYYFEFASAEFSASADDDTYIPALRLYLLYGTDASATVEGHADSRGSVAANERFSKLRAEATLEYLVNKGVDKSKIKTEWKGDTDPAASNETEDGRKLNRRVEITIN